MNELYSNMNIGYSGYTRRDKYYNSKCCSIVSLSERQLQCFKENSKASKHIP